MNSYIHISTTRIFTYVCAYTYIRSDIITILMNTAVDNDDNQEEQKKKAKITDLPDDVFRTIREFVSIDALLLLASRHFYAMKGRLYYYKFIKKYSLEYHASKTFREQVKGRISDISLQLSLNLYDCSEIWDVSGLGGVHTLNLRDCSKVTDVSGLGGVHTLDLSYCDGITDVSGLGGVHTLDLSCCSKITDVSGLGGAHTLDLSCCSKITDVSGLGGVHTLDLSYCYKITDVSGL